MPVRLAALDLRAHGGIATVLTRWEDHVRGARGWEARPARGDMQATVDGAARFLRAQLLWICDQHPDAVSQFHRQITSIHSRAETVLDGTGERRVRVQCPCGTVLEITASTPGICCRTCGTDYDHEGALSLPQPTPPPATVPTQTYEGSGRA